MREAKPYKERGWWISRPFGEYWKLCPGTETLTTAKRILKEKLEVRQTEAAQSGGGLPQKLTVSELFALFLEATKLEKSPHTFADYQRWCIEFAKKHGNQLARDVSKFEAQQFKQFLMTTTWSKKGRPPCPYEPKSVNHALIALRRAFNWAIDSELHPQNRNPFSKIKLLRCRKRERVASRDEFLAILNVCTDDAFRDVWIAMRLSSARPGEIVKLTWSMVDWEQRIWVITEHKTSNTAKEPVPRIFGMNDTLEQMLKRRFEQFGGSERVFLNENDEPWTVNALGKQLRNLRKKAGIQPNEHGQQLVLGTTRHTFLTASGLDPGINEVVLMQVAGHTDIRTTKHYIHPGREVAADASRRIADKLDVVQPTPGK